MFICISKFLRLFFAFVSKIKPQTTDKNAASIMTTLTIKVGKRGTMPVCKNSEKTGRKRINETIARSAIVPE